MKEGKGNASGIENQCRAPQKMRTSESLVPAKQDLPRRKPLEGKSGVRVFCYRRRERETQERGPFEGSLQVRTVKSWLSVSRALCAACVVLCAHL